MRIPRIVMRKQLVYAIVVFFYVVSAIAFESTPETARISTLAIYAVFLIGAADAFLHHRIIINIYIVALILLCVDVYIMTISPLISPSTGAQITYYLLTCSVLCILVLWLSAYYMETIHAILAANIVGSLILVYRIIAAYGGIAQVIVLASSKGESRIGKLIANENAIGLFLMSGILSCFLFLFAKKRALLLKLILLLSIGIMAAMVLLSGSRKSLLFLVLGAVVFIIMHYQKYSFAKKLAVYLAVILAIIALISVLRTVPVFSTIYMRFELLIKGFLGEARYATDVTRKYMIATGLEEFWESPLFGRGTGRSYELFGTYSHNNFVELLMNYGIVGFCLYYIPYIPLLVRLFKLACRQDIYATFFFVYISMQLALGVGVVSYYSRHSQLITAAAWGYTIYIARGKDNQVRAYEIEKPV